MKVPFVDLRLQYKSLKKEIDSAIISIIENENFIGGESVEKFENDFSNLIGMKHCLSCGNGTDA